ncbi:hypothetical protein QJS04_geneDACA004536 [Acorus gramineus]|uniref:CTP synthase n=1 Tax=Acorus gramineus TaxID=55184 RepID=A0AAV9BVD9_ACOGR|nr:hypothetical protein QJS04_geneDACA004536 [Acorus gramineus]
MKYVVVTGGVVSGLGKGVTASSIGVVLKACGLRVTSIKIDPYLNTDAGTMSPFEHGEVFVLDDGGESVLDRERKGDYLGKTVQVVPHITDAIKDWIESVSVIPVDGKDGPADICVIELGGTVGKDNFCLVHVSLIPVIGVVGEQKTKPTQHSVRELRALGLTPDLLVCRSAQPLLENTKEKLSRFCHVPNQNSHEAILEQLNCKSIATIPDLQEWTIRAETFDSLTDSVKIAMVGKYTGLSDSYLSVVKALLHACIACSLKPIIEWVAASDLEDESEKMTPETHAEAWRALKVLGLERANSTEFDLKTPDPVIIFMPEGSRTHMGSTMRLGSRRTIFQTSECITSKLYHMSSYVDERHRHRYEVNPEWIGKLEEAGLHFVGRDESGKRMEILELPNHPFYVGVQFHPEFKSRPGRPSPVFVGNVDTDKPPFLDPT